MANQNNNYELLKQYCKGKNAEQVKAIEYFCKEEGCLSKKYLMMNILLWSSENVTP